MAVLTQMQEEQRQMREEQTRMRDEQTQMREKQDQMQEEQRQMRDDITGLKLRLELDMNKRFDAINEDINAILEQMTPKSRVDARASQKLCNHRKWSE